MYARSLFVTGLILIGAAQAADAPAPLPRKELPVADCLRTDQISNWAMVDNRTVIVANGPNFYRVTTNVDCPRMDLGGGIRFRGAESIKAVAPMRICGSINEQIVRRDDPPCQIQTVEKIDKATYQSLEKKAQRKGSGAEPNGMVR
ncbi:hypothetical protein KR767_00380 [Luteibacter anthropi]|uniref:DUF3617 family protein n=1 Tax=Luteibacter anthropi TaxID=564369 RepID=A0A7X5ZHQ9_9GAMM|nr:DUF6491 family protein [Luteibacter anthropi]NII06078.1 hypothetical protein [Luteibacter anthropi]URX62584.1 hypothetical protein KR767_00380 [Luteibacter anthropi]